MKNLLNVESIEIEADSEFVCDRSLLGTQFEKETKYTAPSWDKMLDELAQEVRQRS
jgi:hypothetical protein